MEFLKSIFVIHRIDFHFYSVEVFCMFVMLHEHRMEQMRLESKYTFDRYYCNLITMYSRLWNISFLQKDLLDLKFLVFVAVGEQQWHYLINQYLIVQSIDIV